MSFSHRQVAQRFVERKRATGSRMFTRDKVIYSFGDHFPIALDLGQGVYLFNNDRYSSQTSQHQWLVRSAIGDQEIYECTAEEIKHAIRHPGKPIVTVKVVQHEDLIGAIDNVCDICRRDGMTMVPRQKWLDMITEERNMSIFRKRAKSIEPGLRADVANLVPHLIDSERYGKECLNTIIKLLKDPHVEVIKSCYRRLVSLLHKMNGTTLARVEKALRAVDHEEFHLEYLGSMYIEDTTGITDKSVASLFLDEDGVKYTRIGGRSWERRSLTEFNMEDLELDWMQVGEHNDYTTITTTIPPDVLENLPALFTLCDL